MTIRTRGERIFNVINIIIVTLVGLLCLAPFIHVIAKSFSGNMPLVLKKVYFWPKEFQLDNYSFVLSNKQYLVSMKNSVIITVCGTVLSMVITFLTAFVFTRQNLPFQKLYVGLFIFTMFFGGGIIPTYLLFSSVGLLDTYAVLILPGGVGVFNIILMRNFMESISPSLEESARIDGASNMVILFKIILPLSIPAIATISLFFAVGKWNAYFNAVIYTTRKDLMPIQLYLRNILQNLDLLAEEDPEQLAYVSTEGVRASTTISAILPILCVYPFLQKYFVGGMMIGAVKE
ncbi:MAG: carbohydrate ABC transporter permease [Eubacteriales bacterium]|nr:carbohydrate ABC transporter permease [bacterium]MDY2791218.1 carbohydrate ABC transporter permease [Eubacteriales bacterium]